MAVQMTSEYTPHGGASHTLTVPASDLKQFDFDGYSLRIQFRSLGEHRISGIVPQGDLENKQKYWKTDELIKQLEAWKRHLEQVRDQHKAEQGSYSLRYAADYHTQATVLGSILYDLREGDDIWLEI